MKINKTTKSMPFIFFGDYRNKFPITMTTETGLKREQQKRSTEGNECYCGGYVNHESSSSDSGSSTSINDLTDHEIGTELRDEYEFDVLFFNSRADLEVHRKKGVYTVSVSNCGCMWNKWENKPFSFTVVKRKHKLAQEASEYADDESDD